MAHKFKCACGTTTRMEGKEAKAVGKHNNYKLSPKYNPTPNRKKK